MMIYLVKGDEGSQITATLTRDDDGSAVNLTGATVVLKVRKTGTVTTLFTITADVPSPTTGVAVFAFSAANLNQTPGRYDGEIQATFTDSTIETVYEFVNFTLRDDFE